MPGYLNINMAFVWVCEKYNKYEKKTTFPIGILLICICCMYIFTNILRSNRRVVYFFFFWFFCRFPTYGVDWYLWLFKCYVRVLQMQLTAKRQLLKQGEEDESMMLVECKKSHVNTV